MNNKFNIGDDVRTLRDYYFDLENGKYALLKGIELRIAIITVDGYGFENYDITLFIPEHDLELIEPNTIEEEDKKNHILTYELLFETPLVNNSSHNVLAISKDILCKKFIDSLNAHMIHSLRMGTFEIPDIKWEYMNVEEMVIEEDTIDDDVIESFIDLERTQEPTMTLDEYNKLHNAKKCGATVGLDYEKEYNKLLEEHEQTKELLEIAKIALKLTTELISTND
jgi:hypothetical protein